MNLLVPIFWLIVGLILLIKGGDWFVDGASGIARRFHLPEILIGATVVSIGTTLPEVMVSAGAAAQGSGSIAYGNAIGSIICNTSLIAAITIAIKPGPAARKSMTMPVAFFFGAAALYCAVAYFSGTFTRTIGLVLLATFVVYMISTVLRMKQSAVGLDTVALEEKSGALASEAELEAASGEDHTVESKEDGTKDSLFKDIAMLVVGADLLVDNAIIIAEKMGVSEKVIGLTIVALGTSLPELVTAITSLIKGHGSLSLGNIIGANLFNLVLVSGTAITISPFDVPATNTLANGMNLSLVLDIPVMLGVMALMTIPTLIKQKLSRWQGFALLAIYVSYTVLLFIL